MDISIIRIGTVLYRTVPYARTEIAARLELWNKGHLDALAAISRANIRPPSGIIKARRAARRAAQLLRKNQFARAAALAGSLSVADATHDTINDIGPLFPNPCGVDPEDLHDLYGPTAPPPGGSAIVGRHSGPPPDLRGIYPFSFFSPRRRLEK